MPKFESTIGSKQFQGQPMRDVSVPDESEFEQQQQQQPVRRHRHEQRPEQQSYPDYDEATMREFQSRIPQQVPPPGMPREMSDTERDIFMAKKAKREGKERLSDGARRRVEMLIEMVRLTRDVEVDGKMYRLQTLKSRELREALVATAEFDGTIQLVFETRKQLLARSLVMVAGVELDQFLNSTDLQTKLDFIEEIDHSLLLRLYGEYISLANEAQEKYALKTVEDVKEVTEAIKK